MLFCQFVGFLLQLRQYDKLHRTEHFGKLTTGTWWSGRQHVPVLTSPRW